jgi:hypothetical protein
MRRPLSNVIRVMAASQERGAPAWSVRLAADLDANDQADGWALPLNSELALKIFRVPVRVASYIFRDRKSHCPMYCVFLCVR